MLLMLRAVKQVVLAAAERAVDASSFELLFPFSTSLHFNLSMLLHLFEGQYLSFISNMRRVMLSTSVLHASESCFPGHFSVEASFFSRSGVSSSLSFLDPVPSQFAQQPQRQHIQQHMHMHNTTPGIAPSTCA